MAEFKSFKIHLQKHVENMLEGQQTLFTVDVDKDVLWNLYLDSFPEGTNPMYRERREYDCGCCRQFIKAFGNVVAIKDGKLQSIWDFAIDTPTYQVVAAALSKFIRAAKIADVFVTKESIFGTNFSTELLGGGKIITWEHFYVNIPKKFVTASRESIGSLLEPFRANKGVFKRSLEEIAPSAVDTVLELIAQNSLYKGQEWNAVLLKFRDMQREYTNIEDKDTYCWYTSVTAGGALSKIKNHSIGTLLMDITEGVELDEAVRKYEKIVAPTNYKRPKAIFTKAMIERAEKEIIELGLADSLSRRRATLDDITVNNILFCNKDAAKRIAGSVFDELKSNTVQSIKSFDKVDSISISDFIEKVLPTATSLEVLLENSHAGNMVSLIAPQVRGSKSMFKWNNNFSWAYQGNITDSMKENVKAAGGNIDGVLRFSIQWNEDGDNNNDFDAHCIQPDKHRIYYSDKRCHASSGSLDVDIVTPGNKVAVENIVYTSLGKMPGGDYQFLVNVFSHRGGTSGFSAEIEFDGTIHAFEYRNPTHHTQNIEVAVLHYDKNKGTFTFKSSMNSTMSTRSIWGINTNQFHPVSVCMFSPNYWDAQGVGNKHYFFMLNGCVNDSTPNGFFNEFLREDLNAHRKVFEALGGKMKVQETADQLSGVGFSSTKRNHVICKVGGTFNRVVKILF